MPRSGTLWRYKLIRDLVIAGGGKDGLEIRKKYFLNSFLDLPNADLNTTKIKRLLPVLIPSLLGETFVLNSHAVPTEFAKSMLKRGKLKVVYGYRDPRDCILSILEYSRRALPQYSNEFLGIHSVEDAVKFMEIYIKAWQEWTSLDSAFVLQYEEMLQNYEFWLEKIIRYLDLQIPDSKLGQIFSTYLPQQKPKEGVKIHFQHGKANRFRESFNEEELAFLQKSYFDVLEKMGYEI
jgi:hypothetical protein